MVSASKKKSLLCVVGKIMYPWTGPVQCVGTWASYEGSNPARRVFVERTFGLRLLKSC